MTAKFKMKAITSTLITLLSVTLCGHVMANTDTKGASEPTENRTASRLAQVDTEVERLLAQLTLAEKISLVHAAGKFYIPAIERLGIHEMWMSDGPHGVRYEISRDSWAPAGWQDDYATYLPPLTAVAASWDPAMAELHGNVLGAEARHRRKDLILGPGVNMARLPLYGRNFEYMGEDPYLASQLVVPEIRAIQRNDVGATVKHYALNSQELNRTGVNAKPDERTLREIYLPAFEAAVKQGNVQAVMGSYNQYYGTNANQSKHLVLDILKGEWGFKGVLLTDWNVDINTYDAAVNGLDIEMGTDKPSYDEFFLAQPLRAQIDSGKIPLSVLDDKVRRILRVQLTIGMMDKQRLSGERNTAAHRAAARTIAANGVVLLKNSSSLLPLNGTKLKNLLVLGPNADKQHGFGGGSSEVKALYEVTPLQGLRQALGDKVNIQVMRAQSDTLAPISSEYITTRHWTGTPSWQIISYSDAAMQQPLEESWIADPQFDAGGTLQQVRLFAELAPKQSGDHLLKLQANGKVTLWLDGKPVLQADAATSDNILTQSLTLQQGKTYKLALTYQGDSKVTLGWDTPDNFFQPEKTWLAAAKKADVVLYFGGLSHSDDRESIDRRDLQLPGQQDAVISKLLQANPNTVLFFIGGSPVEMPWLEKASTALWGWYGGMEAGHAYADVLLGKVNPSGKLPVTFPAKLQHSPAIALDDYHADESLYKEGVFTGYRWFEQQNITPLFVFGHGLSYSSFSYGKPQLSTDGLSGDDVLRVSLTLTNTSKVPGAEVAQLYLHDEKASVPRPDKELKGFAKVLLQPGESRQVEFVLTERDLSFWDTPHNRWLAEPGRFGILIGSSLTDIRQQLSFDYPTDTVQTTKMHL